MDGVDVIGGELVPVADNEYRVVFAEELVVGGIDGLESVSGESLAGVIEMVKVPGHVHRGHRGLGGHGRAVRAKHITEGFHIFQSVHLEGESLQRRRVGTEVEMFLAKGFDEVFGDDPQDAVQLWGFKEIEIDPVMFLTGGQQPSAEEQEEYGECASHGLVISR